METKEGKNQIIVRKIKDKDPFFNISISVSIILIIFIFEIIMIFIFNVNLGIALLISFLFLLLYLLILATVMNPKVNKKKKHNYILIEKSDITNVKDLLKRDELSKNTVNEKPEEDKENNEGKKIASLKINYSKYGYVGSMDTKVYHKNNCRFVKMIHKDYLDANNEEDYFLRKGYKHCLVCIEKK